ncbi:DUF4157 domain-containing protein [Sphaerisporangium flaviroseum]|uniref:eCIS core domain-containing protein n=1 Tax=Sphaerisporangium flaviroseum TaxID=509199 RepID=UPI0031EB7704
MGVAEMMGRRLGADLGRVRVHTDARADRLAESLNAQAFTTGNDVFFRRGRYAPSTGEGRRLLAHELTHVVQQSHGRVGPQGSVGRADDGYERQADQVAHGLAGPLSHDGAHAGPVRSGAGHPVQRKVEFVNGNPNWEDWRSVRVALKSKGPPMPIEWTDPQMGVNGTMLEKRIDELKTDLVDHGRFDLRNKDHVLKLAELLTGQPQGVGLGNAPPPPGPVAPQMPPAPAQVAAGNFSVEYLGASNKAEVRATLRNWIDYATDHQKVLSQTHWRLRSEREQRSGEAAYYPIDQNVAKYADAEAFRKKYKEARARAVHMSGALNEAEQVKKALVGGSDSKVIGVLRDSTRKIQSVVELMVSAYSDHVYLSNLAANPENIDSATPVKKVAEASLVFTVLEGRKSGKDRIELWALNNKVKSIYDYLGFRVNVNGTLIDHPKGVKSPNNGPGPRVPAKGEWHDRTKNTMTLDRGGADKLLGRGRALLDVLPDELRNV